ncbi:DUF502 domain-containing protein [Pseudomonas sp. GX19020]|uniref:DUF502 domain-containing protein n=1 Tax=Pseudomonadota TaxID=1224 RepID=UPI0008956AB8|nr:MULTISPECIES: DUF502 domain-containing protein [Pseudomonadota]MCL4065175.1 DUF502 domain-containing protein [Pseudomonas sp. GX19020]SEB92087.1 Uncharacterized membrane protein [Rhodobacter sp. 24-YEA-8]
MSDPILPIPPQKRGFFASLRASFLTGLVVVLPVGLTLYLVWAVIGWIDGWILPLIPAYWQPDAVLLRYLGPEYEFPVRGVGVLVFLIFTILVGWIAKGLIGRSIIRKAETMVDRMPVVRSVYGAIKQVAETFFNKKETSFDKACLVEFPRPGSWALGFISTRPKGEIAERLGTLGGEMSAVFVGLTPFTSGMLIFVPTRELVILDETGVDDAAKLIVSGGLVYPTPKELV